MWRWLGKRIWEWRGVWIVAPSVASAVVILRVFGWLQPWEWATLDQFFRWRPLEPTDERIVIVGIDEADLRAVGQWPIPDAVLARLLEKVKTQKPRAIGLDLYRDLPVEPGHSALMKVFQTTPNLIGIEKINQQNPSSAVKPSPILSKLNQVGLNNLVVDADGKLRRGLLSDLKAGESVPSFSVLLAGLYLEAENIQPQPTEANPEVFHWGKGVFRPFTQDDGGYIGADDGGYQILLNYRGPAGSFQTVSMAEVLADKVPADLMRDRIVLIGSTASSLNDFFYTPYSSSRITSPERTAGVEVQANLISQILSTAIDGRPLLQTWSEPAECLWLLLWSGVGATLSWTLRYAGGVKSLSFRRSASYLFAVGALVGGSYVAFLGGWWLPVVPPFLGLGGSAVAITAYIALSAAEIRNTFGRYLSDQVVANLLEHPSGLKLGGETRTVTLLTSDLRGFTALSQRLQPEEIIKILNLYLEYMADVITEYQGTIDEFMGDGILVLFGAPAIREDDAKRAVACAVAMQLAMVPVNQKMKELGLPQLEMGIGINTGEVVVGNIGSEKRAKYGVVGSAVNLTYRIESHTIGGQILISESTLKAAGASVRIDGKKQVQSKGIKEPITIYEVGGIGEEYNLFLPHQEEVFFALPEAIPLQYSIVDGKNISDSLFNGRLVRLSAKRAEVHLDHREGQLLPEPMSNIKFNLLIPTNPPEVSGDIYAKVMKQLEDEGSFYICFTAKPPDVEARLKTLYTRAKMPQELLQKTT